ncbi:uncharacterized protein [Salminus brasiliensis]|uniref:uncharacterized protein n=1 Tax=Salminus brasiliensis TaxID=930266 RepID=UPI003B82E92E
MDTNETLKSLGFEVVDNISNGTFGQIHLATSERYPKQVAVKTMDCKQMSPAFISKFLPRKIEILKAVTHPHIIKVHDIIESPHRDVFIVMEAAKMDLHQKIQELHHIPITQAKKWFAQLVSAVVYLHQQDIVHRDLKCSNVLLTAEHKIKLTDFSLARVSKGPDLSETYCCTPHYAAPEVLLGKPYDPKKSDVWSLGVILYNMVTGSRPFKDSNLRQLPRLQRKPLTFPAGIPVERSCQDFISYMLQSVPFFRPSVTEVAEHPWLQERNEKETDQALKSLGFDVVGTISKGSFAKVKLVTSTRYPNQVAIKIMDCKQMAPGFVSKFLPREIAILKGVTHPHIVKVHEIFEIPNKHVFVVMEAATTDLHRKIKKLHHIPITQAKKWFAQLVSAVVYLHQQDIVHRDLKCSNVLLTAEDQIKLTDFSFGCVSKGPDLSETYCCTPHYAAPEVLLRKPYDPKKSDVWSLGVILYNMVTGSRPFNDTNLRQLPHLQRKPLTFPAGIPVERSCQDLISYMLQSVPFFRPSATEVAEHPWLQERTVSLELGPGAAPHQTAFAPPLRMREAALLKASVRSRNTTAVELVQV